MDIKVAVTRKKNGRVVVAPSGAIDTDTHEALRKKIEPLLGADTNALVLDMSGVHYISSIGLSLIFQIEQEMRKGKRPFVIAHVQPNVARIFKAVKLLPRSFVATLQEADAYLDEYLKNLSGQDPS